MSKNQRGGLRCIVLLAVAVGLCGIVLLPNVSAGVAPVVMTVSGEPSPLHGAFPGFHLTNTLVAVILTAVLLIIIKIMHVNHNKGKVQTILVSRMVAPVLRITPVVALILGMVGASPLFDRAIKAQTGTLLG